MTPALILTGSNERRDITSAFKLGARYAVKPVSIGGLLSFLEHALAVQREQLAVVEAWRVRYCLSEAEHDILRRAETGETPAVMATRGAFLS